MGRRSPESDVAALNCQQRHGQALAGHAGSAKTAVCESAVERRIEQATLGLRRRSSAGMITAVKPFSVSADACRVADQRGLTHSAAVRMISAMSEPEKLSAK